MSEVIVMNKLKVCVVYVLRLLGPWSTELYAEPRAAKEHVVMSTDYGDLVLALYPDVAPAHVAQILKLVKLGAYDSTHFFRIIPGFIVQLSDVNNRTRPLSVEQAAAVVPINAEFSNNRF